MRTAIISVSDKTGIVDFARELVSLGWQIVSTGGTYRLLAQNGLKNLIEVEDFTGFPEGLDGRIKTLTPKVFGGILNLRNNADHQDFCLKNNINHIDMVVVNLYPFKQAYYNTQITDEQTIEQIDIGGPSMIRAAAKNYQYCSAVVDPADYQTIISELNTVGELSLSIKKILAAKVFEMTAHYDLLISKFWNEFAEKMPLRYGENPHQSAAVLKDPFTLGMDLVSAEILNGKAMSYNNFNDANAALELTASFRTPFASIIKHACPCCAATSSDIESAFNRALESGDSVAAFGGIIAVNRPVTPALAEKMISFFNEIVLAPDYEPGALEILRQKTNLRVIKIPQIRETTPDLSVRRIRGGTLIQDTDTKNLTTEDLKPVTAVMPTETQMQDLLIAWNIVKMIKSNGIAIVKNGALIGHGGGAVSRVRAMKQALEEAGPRAQGAVIASDAFFPFADAIELAGQSGISAVVQPGGSRNDQLVFDKCNELGIASVVTGIRGFLH